LLFKPGREGGDTPSEAGNAVVVNESVAVAPSGARALPEAEQLALAFKTAYGKAPASIKTKDGEELKATPGKLLWVGDTAVLLSPAESEADCHACAGTLAIAYLKAKDDGFEVTGTWPDLVFGAGWGAVPDWKLSDAYTQYPAIYTEGGYSGQGYSCGSATITELKPDAPVMSDLIGLSASNGGAIDEETGKTFGGEPRKELEGKIVDVVKGKSFSVKASGTASFTEKYEYRGGKFVPLQETRLSC
jgi:hypothetical protein